MTSEWNRPDWARESIDLLALEQFATSIAALATEQARPTEVLDNVLATIAENMNAGRGTARHDKHQILREKAMQVGYANYRRFEQDLLCLIGERLEDLRYCHLTAADRQLKRQTNSPEMIGEAR